LLDRQLLVGDIAAQQALRHRHANAPIRPADRLQEGRVARSVVAHLVEALCVAFAELLLGRQQQVEIGLEAAQHGDRAAADRRGADDHQPAHARMPRHQLDADMSAQRPAHHHQMLNALALKHLGHRARQPVDAVVGDRLRVARGAVPRQVERDQPVPVGQFAVELLAEHLARGARAMQQQ